MQVSTQPSTEGVCFSQSQVEAIADALGHTTVGLTGSEIEHLLAICKMDDIHPGATKRIRLHNAFATDQNTRKNRTRILGFIRHAMKPERHLKDPSRYEALRARLNQALLFAGLVVRETGELEAVDRADTLSEAQRRAAELRNGLLSRGVHPDVLKFCREELLSEDHFHAVQEAVKGVLDKLRTRTGLIDDGSSLIDRALSGDLPMLAINALRDESQRSEQRGFANLLRGIVGMFRNPTAHAPRIHWSMSREDAEDLLSIVSLAHRRIDAAHKPPRT